MRRRGCACMFALHACTLIWVFITLLRWPAHLVSHMQNQVFATGVPLSSGNGATRHGHTHVLRFR